ncbi:MULTISPECIES: hydantoinase/oxoprolinase family protein [Microbacterium]|uniref:hydantoinase/oxoprolinase family protein n=1 Tax=Microbacterium TaxID=33882 RepID=UPI0020BE0E0F|nr:hydantoinase/oxoprolinase family protein [Microbacterium aurugineum]MCK8475848.1 hydantoinase/oxoprolinase family protein [Microbacterium aurugineum]
MALRFGVDAGGTFTDVCAFDTDTGSLYVTKVSSNRQDPGKAVVAGVQQLLGEIPGAGFSDIGYFAHGTTVGTNTLLTETGSKTGLIVTDGFRDLLELARQIRPKVYDIQADKPTPLVPRDRRYGVKERTLFDGTVHTPLDEDDVRRIAAELREDAVDAVAVCLLYSYLRPDNEIRIREILEEELPGVYVSLSSEVLPEFREFERLSTVVINAYLGPIVSGYLRRLQHTISDAGLRSTPYVTLSNGGISPFETAKDFPVRMVLSGPSTGVVGAAEISKEAGYPDIITVDVGGTSADVSLIRDGQPTSSNGMELDGRPLRAAMLDINTVGAGGGSLAWIDAGGHLKVGPLSAGADPGPACYGKGDQAAVTDAHVVLGVLNPEYLLAGQMKIDNTRSIEAVERLANELSMSVDETADGIVSVVVANMARAIRVISVQRGYDPRDHALYPFGGAGPLHAARLARELGIKTVIVPETPGAGSALGLLLTDIRTDFSSTTITVVGEDLADRLAARFRPLLQAADAWFDDNGVDQKRRTIERTVEMRYRGQNYELPIRLSEEVAVRLTGNAGEFDIEQILEDFVAEHDRLYGYQMADTDIEVVTVRVQAVGTVEDAAGVAQSQSAPVEATDGAKIGERSVYLSREHGRQTVPVIDRTLLNSGDDFQGPAIIEQFDTTTLVMPEDRVLVDAHRNLIITTQD